MTQRLYFDHNATTPVRPQAQAALLSALEVVGNPSSVHGAGRAARAVVEKARDQVAALVNNRPSGVVFTSGGSEANNLALTGFPGRRVLVSAVEHPCVLNAREDAEHVPVDANGVVRLDALHEALASDPRPALVSVMMANNETGVLQPIQAISEIAQAYGALLHTDAVQAAGRVPIDMVALGIDLLTLSGHKIGGVPGAGALAIRGDLHPQALIRGGGQERGRRAGTENAPAIAAFGAACAEVATHSHDLMKNLSEKIEKAVSDKASRVYIFGKDAARLPNTVCLGVEGQTSETLLMALDLAGVEVSAGSACSSGKVEPSHVLRAMGVPHERSTGALRISLGWNTTADDVDEFLRRWNAVMSRLSGNELAA